MTYSLEPRLSVPDFVSQRDKIRNGKPGFEATSSRRLLQATKTGRSPGNDDEVSLQFSKYFTGRLGRSKAYTFEKRQSNGAHIEKIFRLA